jgi:thiol:disulfide interchange protein
MAEQLFIKSLASMRLLSCTVSLIVWLSASSSHALSQSFLEEQSTPEGSFYLLLDRSSVQPGSTLHGAIKVQLREGWHVYWSNPGDSGLAPSVDWLFPSSFTPSSLSFLTPSRITVGPLTNFGYENQTYFPFSIGISSTIQERSAITGSAHASFLICKEDCIPRELTFTIPVEVNASEPRFRPEREEIEAQKLLVPSPSTRHVVTGRVDENELLVTVSFQNPPREGTHAEFFPSQNGLIDFTLPQKSTFTGDGLLIRSLLTPQKQAFPLSLSGLVVVHEGAMKSSFAVDFPVTSYEDPHVASSATKEVYSLPLLLLFGVCGGLLLNLMPCVFPVLSLKAFSLIESANESPQVRRAHGLAFTLGALITFWALVTVLLTLRAGGQGVGWGFQLQNPRFILFLIALLLYFSFNLFGMFEIGGSLQIIAGRYAQKSGLWGSALHGALATFIATPCTAPFMASAVAAAITLGGIAGYAIFTALALGMCLPILLISFIPALGRLLPRPGAWMETFKHLMAFPLLGTIIWLLYVVVTQTSPFMEILVLTAMLGAFLSSFLVSKTSFTQQGRRPWLTQSLIISGFILSFSLPASMTGSLLTDTRPAAAVEKGEWLAFSDEKVKEKLAAGIPVFVDFTATWCLTCQFNKKTVLRTDEVMKAFTEHHVALMEADWTSEDPLITAALERLGRSGVPVYALYQPGSTEPFIFPSLLSKSMILEKLSTLKR